MEIKKRERKKDAAQSNNILYINKKRGRGCALERVSRRCVVAH